MNVPIRKSFVAGDRWKWCSNSEKRPRSWNFDFAVGPGAVWPPLGALAWRFTSTGITGTRVAGPRVKASV